MVIPLIDFVGGINNYCKCVKEYSVIKMNAHSNKPVPVESKRRFYKTEMTMEYYVLHMSEFRLKRKYKPRANPAIGQTSRNKLHLMRKLAKVGYYTQQVCTYILCSNARTIMAHPIWAMTNTSGNLR